MKKNTLTFERKLYVAPACKTHVLQVEDGLLQTPSNQYGETGHAGGNLTNGGVYDFDDE